MTGWLTDRLIMSVKQADLMLRRRWSVPDFRTTKNKIAFLNIKYANTKPLFSCEFSCQ